MKLRFLLEIKTDLENVKTLRPIDGVDSSTMPYFFKLYCENCNEKTDEQCTYLDQKVYYKNKEYNHVVKCKVCERVGTVKLIPGSGREFTAADSGSYVPLMVFECDGLIARKYYFNGGWEIVPETIAGGGDDDEESIKIKLLRNFRGRDGTEVKNMKGRFVSA